MLQGIAEKLCHTNKLNLITFSAIISAQEEAIKEGDMAADEYVEGDEDDDEDEEDIQYVNEEDIDFDAVTPIAPTLQRDLTRALYSTVSSH